MFQRIQTVFLILVLITSVALFFLPLISFLSDLMYLKLYVFEFQNLTPDSDVHFSFATVLPLLLVHVLVIALTVVTIFTFKNRIRQVRLVRFSMLLTILLIVGIFFLYPNIVTNAVETESEWGAGAYIPIINLLFLFLANRSIMKDERLVRSVDRLR